MMRTLRTTCAAAALLLASATAAAQSGAPPAPSAPSASATAAAATPPPATPPAPAAGTDAPPDATAGGTTNPGLARAPGAAPAARQAHTGHFEFGSYGRVGIASDLEGRIAQPINVVSHGTRIDEESYAELELRREDTFSGDIDSRVVATVAFAGPFFHFTGHPEQGILVRNLYAQARYKNAVVWIGSRMYRGDDIYLLDWWPLDNQNTIGGGGGYTFQKTGTSVALHVGMQRLDDPYQHQTTQDVAPFGIGSVGVESLDRPRMVESLKVLQLFQNGRLLHDPKAGMKAALYGEAHEIGAGVYRDPVSNQDVGLPSDTGFLVGAQVGFWTGQRDTYVNMFLRYAHGLAAYDTLEAPTTFANDRTTGDAQEALFAVSGNWETGAFGLLAGGYLRYFSDGSQSPTSLQRYDEGTLVLRPELFLGNYFGVAGEASYQARRYAFPDPASGGQGPLVASMWRFALLPYFSPSGRGSYKRPQFRVVYALSVPDDGARELYPASDVRSQRDVEHYLGLQVEWWFNSSSYP